MISETSAETSDFGGGFNLSALIIQAIFVDGINAVDGKPGSR